MLDIEGDESHSALDGGAQRRRTVFGKLPIPLGARATLTLVTDVSRTVQGEPIGATRAEIATGGPATALDDDPASQAYEGDSAPVCHTGISAAELAHAFASGASLTDTAYGYGLTRTLDQGLDPNGETPNGTAFAADDVPGRSGRNGLRAWGDLLRRTTPLARTLSSRPASGSSGSGTRAPSTTPTRPAATSRTPTSPPRPASPAPPRSAACSASGWSRSSPTCGSTGIRWRNSR